MLTGPWSSPLRIGDSSIKSPLQAHGFMMHGWPNAKNLAFAEAHLAILAALDGRQSAEEARTRFVAAVRDAEMDHRGQGRFRSTDHGRASKLDVGGVTER
ncbi:DUF982 domain-containing protein [Neorhizobium sp. DT-125]|uniref:DUF982 domain-containing protein n=1 Tax=Neorhizobium sp. DT-125 TaxID=3396163 RepID=UPI003F1C4745